MSKSLDEMFEYQRLQAIDISSPEALEVVAEAKEKMQYGYSCRGYDPAFIKNYTIEEKNGKIRITKRISNGS